MKSDSVVSEREKAFVESENVALSIDYVDRFQALRHESGREFLEINSMKININRLARFQLFGRQLTDDHIPEDMAYRLFVWPFLETGIDSETKEKYPEGMISGLLYSARINGGSEAKASNDNEIDIGGISLSTHTSYLVNMVSAFQQQRSGKQPAGPHITNLRISKGTQTDGNVVQFTRTHPRTYTFIDFPRPKTSAVACYKGLYRSSMDTLIKRNVLEGFVEHVARHPDVEQGAMLTGQLCRDSGTRFLYIRRLIPFNIVGKKDQLKIPAEEVWRASREAENSGETVCGFIHNHPPVKHAQGMSAVDVENMYQNYFHPFTRSIIVDTNQILGKEEPVTCTTCPYFNKECFYAREKGVDHFVPGYSMFGWDANAALFSMPMIVVE